ncbi:MAG: biotin/lipoyl-containing protein [Rikenellaceae bacterium]
MKEYNLKINGNDYVVTIDVNDDISAEVVVNGSAYHVELGNSTVKKSVPSRPQVAAAPASHAVSNAATPVTATKSAPVVSGSAKPVTSPLPGVILDLKVAVGDTVSTGQTLAVLEAMKMENNIDSNFSGVVKSINVKCGDSVLEGDVLITIE